MSRLAPRKRRSSWGPSVGAGRVLALLAGVASIALICGGCQAADDPSETRTSAPLPPVAPSVGPFQADGFTVGIANYSLATPYLAALNQAMEDRASEVGVEVISKDAGGDADRLTASVIELLEEDVDGIIVSSGDLANVPGVPLAMRNSRVSLVFVGRAFDSGAYNASIGPDYVTIGWDSCDYIGNALGGRGKVATIAGGPVSHPVGQLLAEGFESCVEETLPEMSLVEATTFGGWTEEGGRHAMNSLLAEHGDVVAVFCQDDAMCLGAQRAAAEAGRSHEMIFVGVGGTSAAFDSIMDGTNFNATSLLDPQVLGAQGINLMATIFRMEDFVRNSFVPSPLVRSENVAEYYDPTRSY